MKWIPVKERLPKPEENVLICFYDGRRKKVSDYPDGRKKSIRIDKIISKYGEPAFWSKGNTPSVIAWMPLPEPYEDDE